ncbi:hypothetical protein I317_07379 [Kwoniella heveanensis CBS 569]|nr:hypothetical protein I317_07379 [Kwoniella heveanensis CBS 569]
MFITLLTSEATYSKASPVLRQTTSAIPDDPQRINWQSPLERCKGVLGPLRRLRFGVGHGRSIPISRRAIEDDQGSYNHFRLPMLIAIPVLSVLAVVMLLLILVPLYRRNRVHRAFRRSKSSVPTGAILGVPQLPSPASTLRVSDALKRAFPAQLKGTSASST